MVGCGFVAESVEKTGKELKDGKTKKWNGDGLETGWANIENANPPKKSRQKKREYKKIANHRRREKQERVPSEKNKKKGEPAALGYFPLKKGKKRRPKKHKNQKKR